MGWIRDLYLSSLTQKAIMAVTGLMLFGFVVGHLAGNLKLYAGPYADGDHAGEYQIDVYAEGLRGLGAPFLGETQLLWIARAGLILAVLLHIAAAWRLTVMNRRARPAGYASGVDWQASTYASRTMRWGGVIILLFVIYHLLHFTFGTVHPDFRHGAVYHNVVTGFRQPLVSAFYIVAQVALGMHLYHGLWSWFQSLGISGPRIDPLRRRFAMVFALLITLGNISFPIAVLAGIIG